MAKHSHAKKHSGHKKHAKSRRSPASSSMAVMAPVFAPVSTPTRGSSGEGRIFWALFTMVAIALIVVIILRLLAKKSTTTSAPTTTAAETTAAAVEAAKKNGWITVPVLLGLAFFGFIYFMFFRGGKKFDRSSIIIPEFTDFETKLSEAEKKVYKQLKANVFTATTEAEIADAQTKIDAFESKPRERASSFRL